MSSAKIDKFVRMANQIGQFYSTMPEPDGVKGAASHLKLYWTPKMIGELAAWAEAGHSGLNPTAARAIQTLKESVAS